MTAQRCSMTVLGRGPRCVLLEGHEGWHKIEPHSEQPTPTELPYPAMPAPLTLADVDRIAPGAAHPEYPQWFRWGTKDRNVHLGAMGEWSQWCLERCINGHVHASPSSIVAPTEADLRAAMAWLKGEEKPPNLGALQQAVAREHAEHLRDAGKPSPTDDVIEFMEKAGINLLPGQKRMFEALAAGRTAIFMGSSQFGKQRVRDAWKAYQAALGEPVNALGIPLGPVNTDRWVCPCGKEIVNANGCPKCGIKFGAVGRVIQPPPTLGDATDGTGVEAPDGLSWIPLQSGELSGQTIGSDWGAPEGDKFGEFVHRGPGSLLITPEGEVFLRKLAPPPLSARLRAVRDHVDANIRHAEAAEAFEAAGEWQNASAAWDHVTEPDEDLSALINETDDRSFKCAYNAAQLRAFPEAKQEEDQGIDADDAMLRDA